MKTFAGSIIAAAALCGAILGCSADRGGPIPLAMSAEHSERNPAATTIVLVHGAWADASGWYDVTRALQERGYKVVAVQNSLFSFATDIQTTKRAIDAQQGPIVVVGHSYGGAVITAAASGNPNVEALVYVAAFAPDANEALGALLQRFPDLGLGTALVPDAAGFLYIDTAKYPVVFANGLPLPQARAMATEQKPIAGSALGEPLSTPPAWKTIPSWYVVATEDRAINPDLERFMAKRMSAKVTELRSGHLVFIARAAEVARIIEEATR
jgi:pimeloyl-ACP methyl ester carboxylesterase